MCGCVEGRSSQNFAAVIAARVGRTCSGRPLLFALLAVAESAPFTTPLSRSKAATVSDFPLVNDKRIRAGELAACHVADVCLFVTAHILHSNGAAFSSFCRQSRGEGREERYAVDTALHCLPPVHLHSASWGGGGGKKGLEHSIFEASSRLSILRKTLESLRDHASIRR